ncbi:MAG TPA: phytanoyl-CoA dioxygenase family protein, partial [Flavobacterium sp.]|nr:phytanoyl-CoA dioxygenase family protein [Flavobacterium sp.]
MRATFLDENRQHQFLQKGYVKLPLISSDEADELLQFYKSLPCDIEGHAFHSTLRSADFEYRKIIDEKIQGILRPKIDSILDRHKLLFANYLVKEANVNSEVGVHQDWRFVDESKYRALVIWCTLTDTFADNGPLFILEGSHKLNTPVSFRFAPNLNEKLKKLVKDKSAVIYAKKGEAILYDSAIFHFSPP